MLGARFVNSLICIIKINPNLLENLVEFKNMLCDISYKIYLKSSARYDYCL